MATATAADTAAINALRDAELAAMNTGDLSLSYVSDEVHVMPPGQPAMHGKAALRSWWEGLMAQFDARGAYTSSSIVFAGDYAVETYTGTLTMTPKAGGDPMTETFKGVHVYHRGADGNWLMVQDIWNMDTPPPGAM